MDGIPALPLSLAYSTEEEKNKAYAPLSHSETTDWHGFGSFGIATRVPNRKQSG